jgi:D-alanyl-lipoteichoic acid acyltransferase DltB (MBOAT superfamily)
MFFDSVAYLAFFPLVWLVYQFTPDRQRWVVLLTASVAFYAALNAPILLVSWFAVVILSYYSGLAIARQQNEHQKKRILWTGIIANLSILCLVKYLRDLVAVWNPIVVRENPWANLFLTIGVSYYTLQAISYLSDVYLETAEPEHHFGLFAVYLGFFPKLLQGPIERAGDLLPQLRAPYKSNYDDLRSGLLLFLWGLFKKVAVANRLAPYVNAVYGDVHASAGITFIVASYMYSIQILADFSGYTDMALGVARMFNIRLTQNFNSPYLATSVADFWRRWHISFSRWILDYIFKPLQLLWRSAAAAGTAAALLVTFLFSGLWHGATWNFVVWGLLHGTFLASSVLFKPTLNRILSKLHLQNYPFRRQVQMAITFNLVTLAWIVFRANSLPDAWYVVTHLTSGFGSYVIGALKHLHPLQTSYLLDPILMDKGLNSFAVCSLAATIMFLGNFLSRRVNLFAQPAILRWPVYYCLILALAYFAVYDDIGFVYLQF